MVSNHFTEKSNSYFITFDTVQHSLNALREIRKEHNVRAKMAHYKVFFTVEGLNETSDYNTVKTQHRDLIHSISNCSVLFYKLYRREGKYLGCGDLVVDTKEALDHLMSDEGLKTFNLECGISGTHYHFRSHNVKLSEHTGSQPVLSTAS